MTGEAELSGQCILVMEDNGVIARNAVSAVRGASVPGLGLLPTAKMHSPSSRTPDPTQEKPVQLWRAVNSFAAAFGMTQGSAAKGATSDLAAPEMGISRSSRCRSGRMTKAELELLVQLIEIRDAYCETLSWSKPPGLLNEPPT